MKILMINVSCGTGSTGRICTDLAQALEAKGHQVKIAYGRDDVPAQFQKYAHRVGTTVGVYRHVLRARLLDESGFGSRRQTEAFVHWVEAFDPDIIHLHNLCGYYIHLGVLFSYLRRCGKRIFWTHHDCWAFTGHSVYCDSAGCTRWQGGCHHCPMRCQFPAALVDGSARNWKRKRELFSGIPDMRLVAPSQWMAEQLKQSFLGQYPVSVIHNGINTALFRPLDTDTRGFLAAGKRMVLAFGEKLWDIEDETLCVVFAADFHGRELEGVCRQADAVLDLNGEAKNHQHLYRENIPVLTKASEMAALCCLPSPEKGADRGYWSCKKEKGLLGKEVILGVTSVWNDQKGLSDFVKLAGMLTERQQIVLIGLTQRQIAALPREIRGLERTANVRELAEYYGIADYYLNLTYQDTYPTTNLEAICCGTPVISYRTGGSTESAQHFGTCVPRGAVAAVAEQILTHPSFQKEAWDCDKDAFLREQLAMYKL